MEHGAGEHVEEQSQAKVTIKTEMEETWQPIEYVEIEVNLNCCKEELELGPTEISSSVKEQIPGYSLTASVSDMDKQWSNAPPITESGSSAPEIPDRCNIYDIKGELGDTELDLYPVVYEYADIDYTSNQIGSTRYGVANDRALIVMCQEETLTGHGVGSEMSLKETVRKRRWKVIRQDSPIYNDNIDPILCGGVEEETIEDELGELPLSLATPSVKRHNILISRNRSVKPSFDRQILTEQTSTVHGNGSEMSVKENVVKRRRKADMSVVRQDNTINDNVITMLCGGETEETIEDEQTDFQRRDYICDYCRKAFATKGGVKCHIAGVHSTASYECGQCKKRFKCGKYLKIHTANVHTALKQACNVCGKSVMPSALPKHMRYTHRYMRLQCKFCGEIMKSKLCLRRHLNDRHGHPSADAQQSKQETQPEQPAKCQLHKCDRCPKACKRRRLLTGHYGDVHGTGLHKCTKCKITFKYKKCLSSHVRNVHDKPEYECRNCKRTYKTMKSLREHVSRYHGRKPRAAQTGTYICDYCQKSFTVKRSIQKHVTFVHANGRHECSRCYKHFKCKRYLTSHMTKVHNSRRQVCNVCGKSVTYLARHKRNMHSDEELQCKVCGEIMKTKRNLHQHLNDVHGQPYTVGQIGTYICDYCQMSFTMKGRLQKHVTSVHGSGRHECSRCYKHFKCKRYLTTHMTKVHNPQRQVCNVCGKYVTYLTRHKLNMHSDEELQCKVCGEIMKTKHNHRQHLNDVHGQPYTGTHQQQHEASGKCTRTTLGDQNAVANTNAQLHNVVVVKEEPADGELELGPVVLQHMDCNFRPYERAPPLD